MCICVCIYIYVYYIVKYTTYFMMNKLLSRIIKKCENMLNNLYIQIIIMFSYIVCIFDE